MSSAWDDEGMTPRPAHLLCGWAVALLAAGDAVRYVVGYVGWAIVCAMTLVAAVAVLVRARPATSCPR